MYKQQRNITITEEQQQLVKENYGLMNIRQLSKRVGVTYNVLYKNMILMGLVKQKAKVVQMDGNFNLNEFAQYYKY